MFRLLCLITNVQFQFKDYSFISEQNTSSPKVLPHFLPAGGLWSRLGSGNDDCSGGHHEHRSSRRSLVLSSSTRRSRDDRVKEGEEEVAAPAEEEDDSTLQKMWGAMIKQKQERVSHKMKKSRLDNLPSLQIEISRDSSGESDA